MKRGFRLGAVLRARQAQEDAAKGAVVAARGEAATAADRVQGRRQALQNSDAPTAGHSRAFVAALLARQGMAATLAAATQAAAEADQRTADRVAELTEAATRRRTVEKLAERHAEALRRADQSADQRATDELAVTNRQRSAARRA